MKLEQCPACGKEISVKARSCPNCGEPLEKDWDVAVSKRRLKGYGWRFVRRATVLLIVIIAFGSIFSDDDATETADKKIPIPETAERYTVPSPRAATGTEVLEQMTRAFVGNPSRDDILYYLGPTLVSYGELLNEDTYRRAGSALVTMRKETGVTEMEILRCIASADAGQYGTFADMVAVCATLLK